MKTGLAWRQALPCASISALRFRPTASPFSCPFTKSWQRRPSLQPSRAAFNSEDKGGDNFDETMDDVKHLLAKYGGGSGKPSDRPNSAPAQRPMSQAREAGMGDGIFLILLVNFAVHIAQVFWRPPWLGALALSHWSPQWWQFVTAAFVHGNWEHLLGNAFSLLVFGRMVEEEEGAFGVWATYLVCGIGGNIASYLSSPHSHTVSLGASSAVFGLFMVGVLTKLRPSAKQLLEAVVLGSFVVRQVVSEVGFVANGKTAMAGGMQVGHWAHLGGAAAGVALVLLLSRLPAAGGD